MRSFFRCRPASKLERQPALDRAQRQTAFRSGGLYRWHIVQHPTHFRAGEIGVEQQSGFGLNRCLMALFFKLGAKVGAAPVLPHNRRRKRLTSGLIPCHNRLALIGDPNRRNRFGPASLGHHFASTTERLVPDFIRVMLNPTRLRIMLGQISLSDMQQCAIGRENHRSGRSRPFIKHENGLSHKISLFRSCWMDHLEITPRLHYI